MGSNLHDEKELRIITIIKRKKKEKPIQWNIKKEKKITQE
jgi:hypothetical protein